VVVEITDGRTIRSGEVFVNGSKLGDINVSTRSYDFIPQDLPEIKLNGNELRVFVTDSTGNEFEEVLNFNIR
jgi:hypothetical protein